MLYKEALGRKTKLSKSTETKCITTVTRGLTIVTGQKTIHVLEIGT